MCFPNLFCFVVFFMKNAHIFSWPVQNNLNLWLVHILRSLAIGRCGKMLVLGPELKGMSTFLWVERVPFPNERWPSEHEPLQSATKKLICHISSSSASSSWGWDHNVEKSWSASFLSSVLWSVSFSCQIFFLEHNKGFYNSTVCVKHAIICLHCHSAWYIMDAFVLCSLQS